MNEHELLQAILVVLVCILIVMSIFLVFYLERTKRWEDDE